MSGLVHRGVDRHTGEYVIGNFVTADNMPAIIENGVSLTAGVGSC